MQHLHDLHNNTRGQTVRCCLALVFAAALLSTTGSSAVAQTSRAANNTCPGDNGGITLSPGFCATVFADNIGHARHMVVAPNGVVYANTWSGRYYAQRHAAARRLSGGAPGHQRSRTRRRDRFASARAFAQGCRGGTGIALYNGASTPKRTTASSATRCLPRTPSRRPAAPEVVVSGMPLTGDHPMHPFIIDAGRPLYVDLGSATNSCQVENRMQGLAGPRAVHGARNARRHLALRRQQDRPGISRPPSATPPASATAKAFAFDCAGALFVTQHGRDQLSQNWPNLYSPEQGTAAPGRGAASRRRRAPTTAGPNATSTARRRSWCWRPNTAGDGGKAVGPCADKKAPVASFPRTGRPTISRSTAGKSFPTPIGAAPSSPSTARGIARRAPQGGYNVVFQPLADGKASGRSVVFADGFAGAVKEPGRRAFRPSGSGGRDRRASSTFRTTSTAASGG